MEYDIVCKAWNNVSYTTLVMMTDWPVCSNCDRSNTISVWSTAVNMFASFTKTNKKLCYNKKVDNILLCYAGTSGNITGQRLRLSLIVNNVDRMQSTSMGESFRLTHIKVPLHTTIYQADFRSCSMIMTNAVSLLISSDDVCCKFFQLSFMLTWIGPINHCV